MPGVKGKSGRRPIPSAIKKLRGNPGRRPLNENEPAPELVLPPAPASLSEVGKSKWDEMAIMLYNQGILTEMDLDMLHLYCEEWETYMYAQSNVARYGLMLIKDGKTGLFKNPYYGVSNQSKERLIKLASEFGMTPSSRSRVQTQKKNKPKSLAEKFFNASVIVKAE